MWVITDWEKRSIVEADFDTPEEAETRRAEMVAEDPRLEHVLHVESYGEAKGRLESS
jgi:hypothetical protein